MTAIEQLWQTLNSTTKPVLLPQNIEQTRRQAEECIQQYLRRGGLSRNMRATLQHCIEQMRQFNPTLQGEAQVYFGLLYRLCDLLDQSVDAV
ncbi:MAG: hypothetical protein OEZ68_04015 [Gammaproteobacteria bacterium]|nr:hypothetical protein [Gammaproteobacteria bacterium]MDH5799952.1 hypothetical protein [Gammaproteobacteria bacterium]